MFSDVTHEVDVEVIINILLIFNERKFQLFQSIIKENVKIDDYVVHGIGARWMKWSITSDNLYTKNVPSSFKGKCYKVIVIEKLYNGVGDLMYQNSSSNSKSQQSVVNNITQLNDLEPNLT